MFADNPNVAKGSIPLSVADMELKNAPEIQEGLKRYIDNSVLGYSNPTDAYLDAVIGFMKRHHDCDVKTEWIYQTQRVVAVLLMEANLPILGIIVGLRPENTVVVMNAATLQFQGLSV